MKVTGIRGAFAAIVGRRVRRPLTVVANGIGSDSSRIGHRFRKQESGKMEQQLLRKARRRVEASSQKEMRYGIKVGGEWYGDFGTCVVEKGDTVEIAFMNEEIFQQHTRHQDVGRRIRKRTRTIRNNRKC